MTEPRIVPELALADPEAGAALLARVFGFAPAGSGRMRLGAQVIELVRDPAVPGHGVIDHLALAVEDVERALAQALARGGQIDRAVTPDGPLFIPEFWTSGTRYVFLEGPEGARVELCARPGTDRPGLPGHDHIGIACRDLAEMRAFFLSQGLTEIAATTLLRETGNVAVCFLGIGGSVVELYAPPGLDGVPAPGRWRRLILEGGGGAGAITGPEGIRLLRR